MPIASARRTSTPGIPRLGSGRITRVLSLDLPDDLIAVERQLLTDGERAHADRGTARVARQRVALRAGLRRLAGEVLATPAADVPLRRGVDGRPELDVPGVDVSCSRAGKLGLVAVAVGHRVGVDVELVRPWETATLMENWLSRAERSSLVALEPSFRAAAVALCWTRKEAVVKGLGLGLTDAMADLECGVQPGVVVVEGWRVESVPVPAGHVATIATRTPQRTDIAPEGLDGRLDA